MTPVHILKMLRQRRGLDENDASKDDAIEKMSPIEKLRECVGWELGYREWADNILTMAEHCGMKIDRGDKP